MKDSKNSILIKDTSKNSILKLVLNDKKNRNALSEEMIIELNKEIQKGNIDGSIRVIIISAIGSTFSSGHNLKEITNARENDDDGDAYFENLFKRCSELMKNIVNCSKPVIAEVAGHATAAGCQLVASCDLAVASEDAQFATPGVNIGFFCSTPMVALSRNVAKKHAMEMLLTGEMIDSKKAYDIGLINKITTADNLKLEVDDLAKKISEKSLMTIRLGKQAFYKQIELDLSEAYDFTSKVMEENIKKKDAIEGIEAFLSKRKPNWSDE
ncbi:enoyl-CoA hydratase [SAR86 cluster bacterium]|nr:enoyl-CoA hydratase [SAR86 cluster bacterium]